MYEFEQICELVRLVGSTGVASIEISTEQGQLRIKGRPVAKAVGVPVTNGPEPALVHLEPADLSPAAAAAQELSDQGVHTVTSPIVGTFYRAPSPDADPYVKVGDFVEKGQVLCIVEAMKLMNEIEADASGTIVKVYCENAQPVEFAQSLFDIRPV